jgi:hypothetical protein
MYETSTPFILIILEIYYLYLNVTEGFQYLVVGFLFRMKPLVVSIGSDISTVINLANSGLQSPADLNGFLPSGKEILGARLKDMTDLVNPGNATLLICDKGNCVSVASSSGAEYITLHIVLICYI